MENLWQRYRRGGSRSLGADFGAGQIYTNASHVLLAINPHRCVQHLYDQTVMEHLVQLAFGAVSQAAL